MEKSLLATQRRAKVIGNGELGRAIRIKCKFRMCTCICDRAWICKADEDTQETSPAEVEETDAGNNTSTTDKGFLSLKKFEDLPLAEPTAKAVSGLVYGDIYVYGQADDLSACLLWILRPLARFPAV